MILKKTLIGPLFFSTGLLGMALLTTPATAQVFDSGPSDSSLFDNVLNLPNDPDIGPSQSIGGDGLTTQINVSSGGLSLIHI